MNAPAPSFSPPRIAPHLAHAFGGVWRLTYRRFLTPGQLLLTLGMVALLAFLTFATVRDGRIRAYAEWTAGLYFSSVLPILAFLLGAGAIRDEMKAGAVDYTLTRPVPRPAFVAFKFLSHLACVQLFLLFALGALLGVGFLRHIPGLPAALPGFLLAQFVTVTTFLAFGYLCGVLTSRYIVLGLIWGAIMEIGVGNIPTQLGRLSLTHQIRAILEPTLPGVPVGFVPEQSTPAIVATLLAVSAILVVIVAVVFSQRELAGGRDA